jgi:DNA-binding beta-propeller fold protein YncE
MATVGSGKYRYELTESWAQLPQGYAFGNTSAVATDSQDRVYVFQRKDPPVMVFERDGKHLGSWGIGAFANPHGIYIASDIVYLTDRDDSVCLMYTLDGKPLQVLGKRGAHSDTGCEKPGELVPRSAGPFNYPTEMVPSPSGNLYVTDGYRNARVHRFDADGRLLGSWGHPGKKEPDHFHLPHSLVVDKAGLVYVCDRENNRIQVFAADGKFLTIWPDLRRPLDISIDRDGMFCISEGGVSGLSPRVSIMDPQGHVVARWDSLSAHGSWIDGRGDIYMALGSRNRIDKYVRQS